MGKTKRKHVSSSEDSYSEASEESMVTSSENDSREEEIYRLKQRIKRLKKRRHVGIRHKRQQKRPRHRRSSFPTPRRTSALGHKNNVGDTDTDSSRRDNEPANLLGEPLQKDIACQWSKDSTGKLVGLNPKTRDTLIKKYQIPQNLTAAQPPVLNPEIKAAVAEASITRDQRLEKTQNQMGKALAALGIAQTALLSMLKEEGGDRLRQVIETLNDAARLSADIHHDQSLSRQHVISLNLDRNVKDLIQNTTLDGWLFGENLSERFKAAKAIEKTGQELRAQQKMAPKAARPRTGSENLKPPPRQTLGGQKYHQSASRRRSTRRTGQAQQQSRYSQGHKPREKTSRRYH
ncbi:hypothetical protein NQ315_003294 [Exocentrus adspersus]|uniref:Uncharacterized protein n=1 Tax=Exocentrus adspersus TaxID=1586481 RepID=A0AAV8VAG8_9CUCU|nr:hypothetical protein NQ315_003294 [Exocentrus adspersus]